MSGRCPRSLPQAVRDMLLSGDKIMTGCRHEVCAAARKQERGGDPGILHGSVGAVREGVYLECIGGRGLTGVDDVESIPHGAHGYSERGV